LQALIGSYGVNMKSKLFLYISLLVDVSIALSKFVAAAFTGSSAMVSEGVHSVIDAISQLLLLWGIKRSNKPPDINRPFGYGKELYFWSFIVSLILFIVGGCISFYEGLSHLQQPGIESNQNWNYFILAFAFVFNCISLYSATKAFNKEKSEGSFWRNVKQSKNPSTFIVMLGDVADLLGLVVAFFGVFLGHLYHNAVYDGVASMLIGGILIVISLILVKESKSLLMGETISPVTLKKIIELAQADSAVVKVKKNFSMYLAPEEVLLQLNTVFKTDLETPQITEAIERIIKNIKTEYPRVKQIFIEPVAK